MGRENFLTIVQLLTPNGQSMIDDDADALKVTFPSTASLAVNQVSGAVSSVNVVSSITLETRQVSGATDSAAVIARAMTTNPTAVADGAAVPVAADKIGRQIMIPMQIRELRSTARASLTNGTETTLLAGAAGVFLDLVEIKLSNLSTVAATVYLREATGGNIVDTFRVPADSSIGFSLATPKPQSVAADTWTVDMEDITGTTVDVDALFVKNT